MSKFGGYEDEPFLAELYDYIPGYFGRQDVDFLVSYAQSAEGATLELGCGTGRILIPTAQAGCSIVGLDLSEYMLARCRAKLVQQPQEVQDRTRLVQGSMTDFDLGEQFALITVPFRPFQHLISVEEQLACLRCANRHLQMGGTLLLDLFQVNLQYMVNPECFVEQQDCSGVELPGGLTMRRTRRLVARHTAEQYSDVEMIFYVTHPDGREERLVQAFPFRYFFRYEVEHLLERCGFAAVTILGDYDKSRFEDDSPEMIFVAQKVREVESG